MTFKEEFRHNFMDVIESQVNTQSDDFCENAIFHRGLAGELRQRLAQVREGGGEKYQKRHAEQGKLFVRERVDRLLDAGSPFLEIAALAAWDMYEGDAPGAGIVTGIGRVS